MLKKVDLKSGVVAQTTFGKAEYPEPFAHTLEYSAASRGPWNIAHTGMLVPEAHEIFVCAQGCLRGVVLTAAEMGQHRDFQGENTRRTGHLGHGHPDNQGFILQRVAQGDGEQLGLLAIGARGLVVH